MFNSRIHGTRKIKAQLTCGYEAQHTGMARVIPPPLLVRPAGTWRICGSTAPPISFARVCSNYKDTIPMTIQRFRTTDSVDNYQPLPRHFVLKPAYFKTNNRANRKSDLTQINPTQPYMLCIIGAFKGIPSYRFYTRHNIKCSLQINLNLLHDTIYGMSNKDQWDTCDMIQRLMITNDSLHTIIFIRNIYLYGNKKKQSRFNSVLGYQRLLIRTDNL